MAHRDDARADNARAKELNNLRLALATFALQLEAFEMRMSAASLATSLGVEREGLPPDGAVRPPKETMIGRQ